MKVTFNIKGRDEAEVAARQCAALADTFRLEPAPMEAAPAPVDQPAMPVDQPAVAVEQPTAAEQPVDQPAVPAEQPPKARRGRKPGSKNKPRELVNGQSPDQVVSNEPTGPVTVATTPVAEPDPDLAREKLRTIALERGIDWLRPILVERGAARLGDLSDVQVSELLHAAA